MPPRYLPMVIPDELRPRRAARGMSVDTLAHYVHTAEREAAQGRLSSPVMQQLLMHTRIVRRNLTAEQARDARYEDLSRRADELHDLRSTGGNVVTDLQRRVGAALERLADEPDSALKRELLALLRAPHAGDAP
ncbi:hypothetical protein [Deinococcus soli (ex Cha et al. 2016)]|uniref:Uncharacterized protein n=2 Tax=Deinococcus soli (ex Cha et al. 2016) TaxID=1309411 RepID=A0AAE3XBQ5_9DEIO|nr:hypothetical protein [Deinococcus soli (ex Cha et al. 2016)]MDR6218562.1 hypothetical protein [Deinococcus soli (ex Cha et al. 2016)]MDR6328359.1 hypothetical protein [Deinococcus soli (ex Cha et al. 2016)]MDR6752970.1 hypothetical protein [Deinococcus soli (ex Cha et al. 2016)]